MTKIITFEGLDPFKLMQSVETKLVRPLKLKTITDCRAWPNMGDNKFFRGADKTIVIGHSFGAATAMEFVKKYGADYVVLLDTRTFPFGFEFGGFEIKHPHAYNFYRKGFMTGYEVKGADNFKLPMSVSHIDVPAHKSVHSLVMSLIAA